MIKFKLSVITMVLLCAIPTISSRIKEHEVVENANTESTATILGSNPNQSQNEEGFRVKKDESKNIEIKTSKYTGVSWNKQRGKWNANLIHNKKKYYGGFYKNKEHAAMNVNLLCDKCHIKRKNLMIDIELPVQNHTSIYSGVSWHKNKKQWQARLRNEGIEYYGGFFDIEEHAAMSVNLLCDKCHIERKNLTIDIKLFEAYQVHNSTSQYIGVSWEKN